MRRLFVKIFLSFWLAQALFMVLAMLLTLAMRPPNEHAAIIAQQSRLLDESVLAFHASGVEGLRTYFRTERDSIHARLFLFDEHDKDVTGREPPDWITKVVRGQTHTADTLLGRLSPSQFLKQTAVASDGLRYTLVIELPPEKHAAFGPNGDPWLAILIGIASSGLVCFLLARYLTSPITDLRRATQKLAAGDLTARAGASHSRRRDEMSELLRDFDRMAGRLEGLVDAQSRLLKDISHELRSPLARLNVALALARQRTGPEAQSSLDRMEREADRLNEMIGRLLTIARLEAGGEVMKRESVSLASLVTEISTDAAFEAQSRNCTVVEEILSDDVVMGDASLLYSAIENVVRNAIRYSREGTTVRVRLEHRAGESCIKVTDYGEGVPEEALDKLFEPFYRIDDARGRGTGGVGLGLAIAARAIRLHGGTIRASNQANGGLMVEMRIPGTVQMKPDAESSAGEMLEIHRR